MYPTLFYIIGFFAIFFAFMVVFTKNPVNSVLAIICTMFCITGEYILLNAQFLAGANIIVYAGAIMVLFLFVLMFLNLSKETEPQKSFPFKIISTSASGILLLIFLYLSVSQGTNQFPQKIEGTNPGLVKNLGKMLFTDYVVPFEIASILFLAAMVGAVMLGKKSQENSESL